MFEAFHTSKSGHTGLGLAFVRQIVEQHGGKVFEDGNFQKGVRFNIILPIYT
ncbi:MAG: HAMP domain-containing histidine kinase [bacterium]|nr:HAMP domain-containing histidine kinase [bacterium]